MRNLLGISGFDPLEIEEEHDRMINLLSNLGLSEYEARAYVALVALKEGTAEDLSNISKVPRTSIYKVMRGLEGRDLVIKRPTKPIRYTVNNLEAVEEQIVSDIREGFSLLRQVEGLLSEKGTPAVIFTISGRNRIIDKIGELIDAAERSIFLASPDMKALRLEHGDRLTEALGRGVEIILVMEPFIKSPDCTEAYRREGMMVTDLIVDEKATLIATPDLELCGFIDNPFITSHFNTILRSSLF